MRFSFLFFFLSYLCLGQEFEVTPPDFIKTIQFKGSNQSLSGTPIIPLNGKLHLSFDDLTAQEADYYYTIKHFNHDWTESDLARNEYMEGFDNMRILNFFNSSNTLQSYTHYKVQFPNNNIRRLKVSGNYMLFIKDGEGRTIFSRKFIVQENLVNVPIEVRRSRDLDYLREKQVLYFSVGKDGFIFRNPEQTVKVVLVQNQDHNEAIYGLTPQFTQGNNLIYRYDDEASFFGGNEYLFFDNNDIRMATQRVQRIELDELYNTFLRVDRVRDGKKYIFNPDVNGGFKINTQQGEDPTREAEYAWVHFSLNNTKDLEGGELHLYGRFNNYTIDDNTMLQYNEETNRYETKKLLKQGFYNYNYVYLGPDGSFDPGFISGNHDITENQYQIIVYYRDIGERFDRVIGVGEANSKNIIN